MLREEAFVEFGAELLEGIGVFEEKYFIRVIEKNVLFPATYSREITSYHRYQFNDQLLRINEEKIENEKELYKLLFFSYLNRNDEMPFITVSCLFFIIFNLISLFIR